MIGLVKGANMTYDKAVSSKTSPMKKVMLASPTLTRCSACHESISFSYEDEPKSSTNKENQGTLPTSHIDNVEFDDSGYLSLHNSQIEHDDHDLGQHCEKLLEGTLFPAPALPPSEASQSHPKLPQLQFQKAVCKYLAQSRTNRTGKFDMAAIAMLAKECGLHNVIGGKMGLDYVDILRALWEKDMKHILTKILCRLTGMDLINCKKVSRSWRKVILHDGHAFERCQVAERRILEVRRSGLLSTRDLAVTRPVLSCIQGLADTPVQKSTKRVLPHKGSQQTRHKEYQEAASTLKQHESLKSCKRCGSPAKCSPDTFRATCTRLSCGFDFCTQCLKEYHGSSPCPLVPIGLASHSRSSPVVGSYRSKLRVRRL